MIMRDIVFILLAFLPFCSVSGQFVKGSEKHLGNSETLKKYKFIVDDEYGDSIPSVVYDHMDTPPEFPGGIEEMDKFIRENLKFPSKAWIVWKKRGLAKKNYTSIGLGTCIVRKDGKAILVRQSNELCPDLQDELARVVSIMPRWKPAELNGQAIDVMFSITTNILDPYLVVPYSAVPLVKENRKLVRLVDHRYAYGMDKNLADSVANKLFSNHKDGWSDIESAICGARLLAALGRYGDAAEMLKETLEIYHTLGFRDTPNPETGKYMLDPYFTKDCYDPVKELDAAITLVAITCMSGEKDSARVACDNALELIDMFLVEGMGEAEMSMQEIQMRADLLQEKAEIVDRESTPSIRLNSSDRHDIEHEMMLGARNREIDKRIAEGKISNARVVQITNQLENMFKERQDKATDRNTVFLYQLKAMLIGMRDGIDEEKKYIEKMVNGDGVGNKVAERMDKWNNKISLPVCDEKDFIECVVFYAPLNDEGIKSDEARKMAGNFYDRLRQIEKVYPLKWLKK